jgi:hypothetical protein
MKHNGQVTDQQAHPYIGTLSIVEAIAHTVSAYHASILRGSSWAEKHAATLQRLAKELPSGSGIDCGTEVDQRSTADRIVLTLSFHHMNESGMYSGWTSHEIIITPSFIGRFSLRITGRDRNQIKEYLSDVYSHALSVIVDAQSFDRIWPAD